MHIEAYTTALRVHRAPAGAGAGPPAVPPRKSTPARGWHAQTRTLPHTHIRTRARAHTHTHTHTITHARTHARTRSQVDTCTWMATAVVCMSWRRLATAVG